MYVKLGGEMVYLWRAVDHEGEILESYVTKSRDKAAALAFMKKALKRHGSPTAIVTNGLNPTVQPCAISATRRSRSLADTPTTEPKTATFRSVDENAQC